MANALHIIIIGNILSFAVWCYVAMPSVIRDLRRKYRPPVVVRCDGKTVKPDHKNVLYAMSALEHDNFGLKVNASPGCIKDKAGN